MDDKDEDEDRNLCRHCNKEVAQSNWALHELHCKRFLCLCPDCDESVPRELLEHHREEQHSQVKCSKCKKKVERGQLLEHESDICEERLESCEFCQLELPLSRLMEHTVACGSRTETCSDCGRYVTLKDQLRHAQTCPSPPLDDTSSHADRSGSRRDPGPEPPSTKDPEPRSTQDPEPRSTQDPEPPSTQDPEPRSTQDPEPHSTQDPEPRSTQDPEPPSTQGPAPSTFSQRRDKGSWQGERGGDVDQISTCPHCHLALPLETLRWHENKCKIFEYLKRSK